MVRQGPTIRGRLNMRSWEESPVSWAHLVTGLERKRLPGGRRRMKKRQVGRKSGIGGKARSGRPPSRSERLLRETLRRDGEVRESGITSPSRRPSASRRHSSRVSSPTSPPLPASASCGELHIPRPSSPSLSCRYAELADEQYTRGTFLFRSAITNAPNSPQFPGKMECMYAPAHPHVQGPISTDGTVVPVLNGNGPHSPSYHPRISTRSASPSPPPTLNGGIGRRHSLQRSFHHEARTPQEHALRAQLESYFEDAQRSSPMTICRRCDQVNFGVSACCDQARSESMSQPQFVSVWFTKFLQICKFIFIIKYTESDI
ncbi:hypothetical protein M378DRAFT_396897 [Amanita muscaria Koide BX008]|uniref:Uncharacterized protein n=1 Tax=Amanita muscaria (strain Koide BX008) TaxID=946122 RepID=A0A0C2STD8_AMAMK|nr:hypothetical protein M378DRAFT_396897 [Amanita muscaria Koide BX008]